MDTEFSSIGAATPSNASEATNASLARPSSVASIGSPHTYNAGQNEDAPQQYIYLPQTYVHVLHLPSNKLAQQHHSDLPQQPWPPLQDNGNLHNDQGTSLPLPEPLAPHTWSPWQAWAAAMEVATCATCPSDAADNLRQLLEWGYGAVLRNTREGGRSLLELAASETCFDGVEAVCAVLPEQAFEVVYKGCHTLTPDQLHTVERVLDEMEFRMPHERASDWGTWVGQRVCGVR
jgi:hypothetical protein